jgi:hypothetical protein
MSDVIRIGGRTASGSGPFELNDGDLLAPPQVSTLRLLDVLSWRIGRRAPADDAATVCG